MRVGLVYKNFAAWAGISHIGLGVAAEMDARYLNAHGVEAKVIPVRNNVDIVDRLRAEKFTHIVISAPWLSAFDLDTIVKAFPNVEFVICIHSNIGFLQADPGAISLMRRYIAVSQERANFHLAGNCRPFVQWLEEVYNIEAFLLPNLYPFDRKEMRSAWNPDDVLRIGTFGAIRPQKNVLTAAAAALLLSRRLGVPVEFNISTGREDGGASVILQAIREMSRHTPGFHLCERSWSDWHDFKRVLRGMNLLIQVSYTESFNIVTADGISEGVPSVVSEAIAWAPKHWRANPDSVQDVAYVAERLLGNAAERHQGIVALYEHNQTAFKFWEKYLTKS